MWHLFKMEFLHHHRLALGLGLVHLMALYYLYTLGTVFYAWPVSNLWLLAVTMLSALVGILQMLQLKRDNEWLYLLHRPLATKQIFLAVSAVGFCNLVLAILLPLLIALVMIHMDGRLLVEPRHYPFPLLLLGQGTCGYLCGSFAVLNANRLALFGLVLCSFIIAVTININQPILVTSLVIIGWAFALAIISFRPDLSQLDRTLPALVMTQLPIQYGILWGLTFLLSLMQGLGNGNLLNANFPPDSDGYVYFQMTPKERMQYALVASDNPDAPFLSQQVNLGDTVSAALPNRFSFGHRYQLPLHDNNIILAQPESNIRWSFSHGDMRFVGIDTVTGARTAWLGVNGFSDSRSGATPFPGIPWVTGNNFILDADNIYQLDWETRTLYHRFQKPGGDDNRFSDSLTPGDDLTLLLSENSLYIFATPEFTNPDITLVPRQVFPLPGSNDLLNRYDVMELIDGYLVSALTDYIPNNVKMDFALIGRARLQAYRATAGNPVELIAAMPLNSSISELKKYQTLILSPGIRILTDAVWGLIMDKSPDRTWPLYLPSLPVWLLGMILGISLTSAAVVFCLLRSSNQPRRLKIFWLVMTALCGPVALISFVLGNWWRRADQFYPVEYLHVHA